MMETPSGTFEALTPAQVQVLRRSRPRLRVWEAGAALMMLLEDVRVLLSLGLVHSEASGYEITADGQGYLSALAAMVDPQDERPTRRRGSRLI